MTSMDANGSSPPADRTARAAAWIWLDLPRWVTGRWRMLEGIVGDGALLTASPLVAVVAPVACLVAGLWVGATGWGYDLVVTESVFLLTVLVFLGVLSSHLGLAALAGFACGEFLVGVTTWTSTVTDIGPTGLPERAGGGPLDSGLISGLWRIRLPMVVVYLVLATGGLVVPRLARGLAGKLSASGRPPRGHERLAAGVAYAVVVWLAIEAWVASIPLLTRPMFSWRGGGLAATFEFPPAQTTYGPMHFGQEIVAAAVLGAVVRYAVRLAVGHNGALAATERLVSSFAAPEPSGVERSRWSRTLRSAGAALAGTLVLAGLLERPWTWALALAVFFVIASAQVGLLPALPRWWAEPAGRIPLLARVVILAVVARLAAGAMAGSTLDSFDSIAAFVVVGAAVGYLWTAPQASVASPPLSGPRLGNPGLYLVVAAGALLCILATASPAAACGVAGCVGGGAALGNGVGGIAAGGPLAGNPGLRPGPPSPRPTPTPTPANMPPRKYPNIPGGSLDRHQGLPLRNGNTSHPYRHVAKSDGDLLNRTMDQTGIQRAGTYQSPQAANEWTSRWIAERQAQIDNWLRGARPGDRFPGPSTVQFPGSQTGRIFEIGSGAMPVGGVVVVLEVPHSGHPYPFIIVTTYPVPIE